MPQRLSEIYRQRLQGILRVSVPVLLFAFFAGVALGAAIWKPATRPLPRAPTFHAIELLTTAYSLLAEERGLAFSAMKQGLSLDASVSTLLDARRHQSDFALDQFLDQIKSGAIGLAPTDIFLRAIVYNRDDVSLRRQEVDKWEPNDRRSEFDELPRHWFNSVSRLLASLANMHSALHARLRLDNFGSAAANAMQLQYLALLMNDYAGRERAIVSGMIAADEAYREVERRELASYRARIDSIWASVHALANREHVDRRLARLIERFNKAFFVELDGTKKALKLANLAGKPYPITAEEWFARSTQTIENIVVLSTQAGELSRYLGQGVRQASRD